MAVRDVVQAAAGIGGDKLYVEDVFSTYLYTGNSSTQTITNGIDLDGEGGLTWFKARDGAAGHLLFDSARGVTKYLISNLTNAEGTSGAGERLTAYNSNGFSLGTDPGLAINASGNTYASWTFRKAPKFFDVVTYTGNGTTNRQISHSLGASPGWVVVKKTSNTGSWATWHRGIPNNAIYLESSADMRPDFAAAYDFGNDSVVVYPTSTNFTVGSSANTNQSGQTYVAYLFAHNAGGFGDDGLQDVVSCGSFTTDGSSFATVSLGWEPQFVLMKAASDAGNWVMLDTMRGWIGTDTSAFDNPLYSNLSAIEDTGDYGHVTATGFRVNNMNPSTTCIYIAIRRGPMKTPTTGTSVFEPYVIGSTPPASYPSFISGFPVDLGIRTYQPGGSSYYPAWSDRLRGKKYLISSSTSAEGGFGVETFDFMNGWGSVGATNEVSWMFRRAPGFFDEVCYTGTGSATTVAHNLGVAPELMIVKALSISGFWYVFVSSLGADRAILLNSNGIGASSSSYWNSTMPTSTVFSLNDVTAMNGAGSTFVAYLFASCPGVSKVGSYTGTGTTQQINCGFTAGARFVLIKRTDSTGDWYVWDSARGIVAGNDPYLLLNSTAAEVTGTDYIDPYSAGFEISSTAPAEINASGGSFIFLAIA